MAGIEAANGVTLGIKKYDFIVVSVGDRKGVINFGHRGRMLVVKLYFFCYLRG